MLFNSLSFLIFLPIVFVLYWFVTNKSLKTQNLFLLASSYFFYSCWDWRFLFLLLFSTLLDYFTAIKMEESKSIKIKKFWFWLSIIINLGFLGVFKYYNFFIDSLTDGLLNLGIKSNFWTLQVILPVGISFYTFHGLSYVIDIYKNRIRAEKNFVDYAVFVSFFPLLVAGPIERATHLLPQIKKKREFNYSEAIDGLKQIFWGLFKKIVIADNCARFSNLIFDNYQDFNGSALVFGAVFFAFQIYGDFSGYSDIAIGTAKLFGIDLLRNFAFPYFSRDIAEFWRRWHISLSTWFKDYLYIPLGGSKGGTWIKVRNTFIIFLVSGFWHGANWTFIFWGLLNAIYILPSILFKTNRINIEIVARGKSLPNFKEFTSIIFTFSLTVIAWIFFRSKSVTDAFSFIYNVFTKKPLSIPNINDKINLIICIILIILFLVVEWCGRENKYGIEKLFKSKLISIILLYFLLFVLFFFASTVQEGFIYFQF